MISPFDNPFDIPLKGITQDSEEQQQTPSGEAIGTESGDGFATEDGEGIITEGES